MSEVEEEADESKVEIDKGGAAGANKSAEEVAEIAVAENIPPKGSGDRE